MWKLVRPRRRVTLNNNLQDKIRGSLLRGSIGDVLMKKILIPLMLLCSIAAYAQGTNMINGNEYVDLGLPSGTLWATCNVGALSPEECGEYFAWGETSAKKKYNWETLKYCKNKNGTNFSKYNEGKGAVGTIDNKTCLDLGDDVARQNWGGSWRMPTLQDWQELIDNCIWKQTTQGGYNGYKVTSNKNGESIFLPAAGWRGDSELTCVGESGQYWSSTLNSESSTDAFVCYLRFGAIRAGRTIGTIGPGYRSHERWRGHSVRPVSCPAPSVHK